jgi:hypothetical protein
MIENEIKNKMEQLAKSFGVKLGEEVMLILPPSKEPIKCRILEDRIEGYYEFPGIKGEWCTIAGTSNSQENERE